MAAKKKSVKKGTRKATRKVARAAKRKTRKTASRKTAKASNKRKKTTPRKKVRVVARKRTHSVKARASRKTRRPAVKAKISKKTRPTVKAKTKVKAKATPKTGGKPLIPVLDLEKYEVKSVTETGVKDNFVGSTRYAWIGSGQCGGRLVKAFYDLGYKKAIAVNTTHHDLDLLAIPASQKFLMDIGEKGAGKNMSRGQQAASQWRQDILHLTRKTFGTEVDHVMVCIGAGGGTGGGSAAELVNIAKDYVYSIGKNDPSKHVGVIMTLPTAGEANSPQVAENAWQVATELGKMASKGQISPLIIIDNEKISRLYPGKTVREFWPSINNTVAGMFDVFNRLSSLSSPYTTLDPVDYQSILKSGGCAIMGLTRVEKFKDRFALSSAVKQNLEKTLLSDGFNLSTARVAGCTVVGGKRMMAHTSNLQDNINFAFDVLADLAPKATIHRGIYEDGRETLRVYTLIGGLDFPKARVEELKTAQLVTA
jgi:cell division GTPase FtsZ